MLETREIILRLFVASLLGALVGLERERGERAAGLRTHALVGLGACLFMIVSAFGFQDVHGDPKAMLDPSRVAAQVASGVGFLGGGAIILRREVVSGLTTAASIWAVAAVGLAAGGGLYLAAVCGTTLILVLLAWVKPIERRYFTHQRPKSITLIVDLQADTLSAIQEAVSKSKMRLERLQILPKHVEAHDRIDLFLQGTQPDALLALMNSLRLVPGLQEIHAGADLVLGGR
jgi:putative Mg2+ transporter-C (MgtC) family protein